MYIYVYIYILFYSFLMFSFHMLSSLFLFMFFEPTKYLTTAKATQRPFSTPEKARFFRFSGCKSSSGLRVLPVSLQKPGLGSTYVTWWKGRPVVNGLLDEVFGKGSPWLFVGRLTSVIKCEEVKVHHQIFSSLYACGHILFK